MDFILEPMDLDETEETNLQSRDARLERENSASPLSKPTLVNTSILN